MMIPPLLLPHGKAVASRMAAGSQADEVITENEAKNDDVDHLLRQEGI